VRLSFEAFSFYDDRGYAIEVPNCKLARSLPENHPVPRPLQPDA